MSSIISASLLCRILSYFVLGLAGLMLVPLIFSLLSDRSDLYPLALSVVISAIIGFLMWILSRNHPRRELKVREGLFLVSSAWVSLSFLGALPYYFCGHFDGMADAFFESASGFTTTGASVLSDVEVLSDPIQLWRCFSQWLGGMGIVMVVVAILPLIGQGGSHLYRAEFSGSKSQRLAIRTRDTAKALWKIYIAFTATQVMALSLAGMGLFDAVCHAFTTLATGGFSTKTASIAAFDSATIEYIVSFFMLLSGISFIQYYRLLVDRDTSVIRDYELRTYLFIVLLVTAVIALVLSMANGFEAEPAFRAALFQTVSIITTTGFATEDYTTWFPVTHVLLLTLMFFGGCTGSTAGGIKIARIVMMWKVILREFKRMAEPQGVFHIVIRGNDIPEQTVQGLLNLIHLASMVLLLGCLAITATGVDFLTALSATMACMFNIGPGLGEVGPSGNFGHMSEFAKWVLSFCMIAGRLEFYTLIVIFTGAFWRR